MGEILPLVGIFVKITQTYSCVQVEGYTAELLQDLEIEALAIIQPSRFPGSLLWEEAIVCFSWMAQAQQATDDPSLITVEMSVSD